jgi:hypothetical protein
VAEKCKKSVWGQSSFTSYQCSRNVWKDGYCKQHHPDTVAERRRKSDAAYEIKRRQSPLYKLQQVLAEIKSLKEENKELKRQLAEVL